MVLTTPCNFLTSTKPISNGGYSQTNKSSIRAGYMSASPDRARSRPPAAGALNSKTLAEENLKGFRLRNLQKESDLPLRVNQP